MGVPTNTTQTFDQVGIREDLSDVIYNIDPTETPILSSLKKEKTTTTNPEWQIDNLAEPDGDNKTIQGDDPDAEAIDPTAKVKNHTQLMDKLVQVSSTANAVKTAGRARELAYQILKRGKEIKLDMEARITGNYASVAGDSAIPGESAGIEAWIETNASRGAGGADGGYNTGTGVVDAATDGTQRAITEGQLQDVVQQCWNNGGNPNLISLGGKNKQAASKFSGIATQYQENKGTKAATILGAADVYVSDFGTHRIVANRVQRDRSGLVLDTKYWSLKTLQKMKAVPLAKTGHSEKRMLSTEFTLCSKNEAASGIIADLTTP